MKTKLLILSLLMMGFALGCTKSGGYSTYKLKKVEVLPSPSVVLEGTASWYGHPFHGRTTANGEKYNMYEMTAAHKSLPFNSWIRVTNLANHKQIFVRVNDRGPYVGERILDLSFEAAKRLEMDSRGVGRVRLEVFYPSKMNEALAYQTGILAPTGT